MEWWDSAWDFFKKLIHPQSIIEHGGVWLLVAVVFAETGLLVGFFLPGDSLLFTAGLLVGTGKFHQPILLVVGMLCLASVLGDSTGYWIGRRGGSAVFNRKESWLFRPEYVTTTRDFYNRNGGFALVLGKFLPIIRTFAPVMAGVVQLNYRTFVLYSLAGSASWTVSITLIGYFLGSTFPWVKDYLEYIIIGLVVVTAIPIYRKLRAENKLRKAAAAEAVKEPEDSTVQQ